MHVKKKRKREQILRTIPLPIMPSAQGEASDSGTPIPMVNCPQGGEGEAPASGGQNRRRGAD